jgi:hypothetical protein
VFSTARNKKEVAMSKMSIFSKATIVAVLIALLFASIPATGVVAKGNKESLEDKWSQLVSNFNRQTTNHASIHKAVDHWLATSKEATGSEKTKVDRHLAQCNSAIMSAGAIVSKHAGFDTKGKLIERASAIKSIDKLSYYLRQHAASIKNLSEHVNK